MATREVLQQRLDELERLMPQLVRDYPDREDFMQEFCGYADRITEEATAADDTWATEALDGMLSRYGHPPAKDELPADG
jgi:hypothetical protein